MNPVIIEARTWIGTPYKHQHSTKGAGCDCVGLVRGVYRVIVGPEPEALPSYSPSWGEVGTDEPLLDAAGRHLAQISIEDRAPGDVLVFRMARRAVAKHCGILTSAGTMIHAYQSAGVVAEHSIGDYWTSRIVGVFRFPVR